MNEHYKKLLDRLFENQDWFVDFFYKPFFQRMLVWPEAFRRHRWVKEMDRMLVITNRIIKNTEK